MSKRHGNEPAKRIVVPLTIRGGVLVPFYGGKMPPLKEGSVVDLIAEETAFQNAADVARFDAEKGVTIRQPGEKLWAVISRRGLLQIGPEILNGLTVEPMPSGEWGMVPFTLDEPLVLQLRGTKLAELTACRCRLDTRDGLPVTSVNDAYTRLSEHHEPWRRSHTGNVFTKVYFEDGKIVRPLDVLRARVTAEFEKELFHRSGELPLCAGPEVSPATSRETKKGPLSGASPELMELGRKAFDGLF